MAIGSPVTSGTSGSMLFVDSSGNLAQNNSSLFWDDTKRNLIVTGNSDEFGNGPIFAKMTSTAGGSASLSLDATANTGGHAYGLSSTGALSSFGAGAFAFLDSTAAAYRLVILPNGDIDFGDTFNFILFRPGYGGGGPFPAGGLFDYQQRSMSFTSESTSASMNFGYFNGSAFFLAIQWAGVTSGFSTLKLMQDGGKVLIGTPTAGGSVVRVVGLPTSAAGLSTGDVWNNAGILTIV